jgi:hypothetical protein
LTRISVVAALALASLAVSGSTAFAAVDGPDYPPPHQTGGDANPPSAGTSHKGTTGMTWTFPAYDFATITDLYWGASNADGLDPAEGPVRLAFDGNNKNDDEAAGETMTYSSAQSDPDNGILRWFGTADRDAAPDTNYCTRFTLKITQADGTTPIPLAAGPAGVDSPAPVAHITSSTGSFQANLKFEAHAPAADCTTVDQTTGWTASSDFFDAIPNKDPSEANKAVSDFTGGFWWTGKAPTATSNDASGVGAEVATVNGSINPSGWVPTSYRFEYGTTAAYGSQTTDQSVPGAADGDTTDHAVSSALTGLAPSTTYHYRVVAVGPWGTTPGADKTFTTSAAPGGGTPPGGNPPGGNNPPPDLTPPVFSFSPTKAKLLTALKKGLGGKSTSNEAGTWTGQLILDGKTAKKLKLNKKAKATVVGKGSGPVAAGNNTWKAKFTAKAKKALKKLKKVTLTIAMTVKDAAGNSKVVKKKVTLKR